MADKILPANENMLLGAIGINQQMLPVFLGLMLATAIAWLFVSNRLYAELRRNYPLLYESLGSPRFFMKKSIAANVRVIRFLFMKNDNSSLDRSILRMCQGLRSLLYIYIVCLAGCMVLLLKKIG